MKHNFVVCWEDKQFKVCLKSFSNQSVVSIVDFADNYSFEIHNGIQSMHHWYSYHINILVIICFCHNPNYDPYDEETMTFIQYHFYVSNDRKHD